MKPVEEWQLLSLFEVEPRLLDPWEDLWVANNCRYLVEQGDLSLSFTITPYRIDVAIVLERSGRILYRLSAFGVDGVVYHECDGGEMLEIVLSNDQKVELRIKPHIRIDQCVSDG